MKWSIAPVVALLLAAEAGAQTEIYSQPHNGSNTILRSCWWDPDDSDYDQYIWDSFTLGASQPVTEIRWRGGFDPAYMGWGGPVVGFTVQIWSSIAGGSQPDIGSVFAPNPLMAYDVAGNAGQTPAGTFGGVAMYDYHYTLPSAFQAVAGVKYWVYIVAWQHGIPDWGFAAASGGNGSHFRYVRGAHQYQNAPGDAAFSLYTTGGPTYTISASASPANAGTILGAGTYPAGSNVSLTANANTGWGFSDWTESGTQVSTSSTYVFPATANRTLVANFLPTYTVTTSAYPTYGGVITGGGTYNSGSTVTLEATPHYGFVFSGWSDGTMTPIYSFPATADVWLTAFFDSAPNSVTFDFDNAPAYTTLPIDLTVGGLSAHFSSYSPSGGTFAVWPYDTWGISPPGFAGLSLFPTSVFGADLIADFSQTLIDFSILYSPQEIGCDDSATMRATAYMDGVFVGTATMTAPNPGTYPSATLSIAVPAGFNRVVVHYDSRPPTCQDWGPIFLADNCTVTMAATPPSIVQQPSDYAGCPNSTAWFFVAADGAAPLSYQWRRNGADLVDGVTPGGSTISGSASDTLTILTGGGASDAGLYDCVVNNAQGSVTSNAAQLSVTAACDANCDGSVNPFDIQPFIDALSGAGTACSACAGDANGDGTTNPFDINAFLACLGAP